MKEKLEQIYLVLCRDYVKKKKEQVKNYKQQYINKLNSWVFSYGNIQARPFIEKFLPKLRQKIHEYD